MKYLATILYKSPKDTGENRVIVNVGTFATLPETIDFLRENFDGKETFDKSFKHLIERWDRQDPERVTECSFNDGSAGQWGKVCHVKAHGEMELEV